MSFVQTEFLGPTATRLWLNRPQALNALSPELLQELDAALSALESEAEARNPELRVVVIQGRGSKAMSAGADVGALSDAGGGQLSAQGQAVLHHFAASRLITLAVMEGYVLGGGLELAMAADLRLATSTAKLGLPEIALGLVPGFGGTQRLPTLIGPARALWMILSGEPISAAEAERAGLVNWVVAPEALEAELRDRILRLSRKPARALALAKALIRPGGGPVTDEGLARENAAFAELVETEEAQAAIRSFMNGNRSPNSKI